MNNDYPDWVPRNRDLSPEGLRMLRIQGMPTCEEFWDMHIRPLVEQIAELDANERQDGHC